MFAVVEKHLKALGAAQTQQDVAIVLGTAAIELGFRSAFIIEYRDELGRLGKVIDSDPRRLTWWKEYFAGDLPPAAAAISARLRQGDLVKLNVLRFGPGEERLKAATIERDMADMCMVPINQAGDLVGMAGFCGRPDLTPREEMALQLIAYTAFAHFRARAASEISRISLTPREREVIQLSAEGMTSLQIAERLGMSARTANQHVDNVASKLGTRNRAHTVAETLRRGLLV